MELNNSLKEKNGNLLQEEHCPVCHSSRISIFYEINDIPAHSVLLFETREKAVNYPRGDIKLGFCNRCGFISNYAFDANLHEYSGHYEETQGFSRTFNQFHQRLADYLIKRYDLYDKKIIEIGCGKGEFLTLLCQLGNNKGIGFDPAFVLDRFHAKTGDSILFLKEFYSEKHSRLKADFICCKMTLEHIFDVASFLGMIKKNMGDRSEATLFFQVPDVQRILMDFAFFDIYYEHCSYFSESSLASLFNLCGFQICNLWKDYDDQYLMIEAKPDITSDNKQIDIQKNHSNRLNHLNQFSEKISEILHQKKRMLKNFHARGKKVIIWGAGSKAVSYLTTLKIDEEIQCAVDINPFKQGTFLAGSGHQIVSPEFLKNDKPDVVIIMNPVYYNEIKAELEKTGCYPSVITP